MFHVHVLIDIYIYICIDYTAKFVNLVEEKWSVEVNLDGSGTLVVLTDILEQVSFRSGSRNF